VDEQVKDYEIFDSANSLVIAFPQPVILDLVPLMLKAGLLYPGTLVYHIGGSHTSAGFWILSFDDPVRYRGLYHSANDGLIACFTQGLPRKMEGFAEWYYCYVWMPEYQCFYWNDQKNLTARTIETDNVKMIGK